MNLPILTLDPEEIQMGMSDQHAEWLLDLATGKLCLDPEEAVFVFDRDEAELWAPTDPDQVLPIPPFSSSDGYRLMQEFALEEASNGASEPLLDALKMRKPFRRFKDALGEFPDDERRWFEFQIEEMKQIAEDFYETEGYAVHWTGAPGEPTGLL